MTDREKLISLMMQAKIGWTKEELATYLITNGVTVQHWIPVTERLPDKDGKYLVHKNLFVDSYISAIRFAKDGRKVDRYAFENRWKNVWYEYDSEYGHFPVDTVTHWMPLPQPPKEGE